MMQVTTQAATQPAATAPAGSATMQGDLWSVRATCPAECGQAAASRLTEVVATTVPAGHRRLGGPSQEQSIADQTVFCWPHSNEVPSTQIQWRITAIFRAMAT